MTMSTPHDGSVGDARKRHAEMDGCPERVDVNGVECRCERLANHSGSHVTHPPHAVVGWGAGDE